MGRLSLPVRRGAVPGGTVNLSSPRAIFAGSPPRFTRSRVTYEACAVSRTSTRPQVDSAPNTEWLKHGAVELDGHGFIRTGIPAADRASPAVPLATNQPGIFAVGDVRADSIKRVAPAVGEGSVVVSSIHDELTVAE